MKCDHIDKGCNWEGTIGTLEDHYSKCEYVIVSCKYESIGCLEKLERREMKKHEQDDGVHLHLALEAVVKLQKDQTSTNDTVKHEKENDTKIILKKGDAFTFKVSDHTRKKNCNKIIPSNNFYTSFEGYCMRIVVYLNGNKEGRGTHISVYACFNDGRNDHKLIWPFIGSVTVELLNQLADGKHYYKTIDINESNNISAASNMMQGFARFISHTLLPLDPVNNTQYLKDDTLYFRVSVEVPNHKPWLECTV